jgi:hypothetical protein
MVKRKNWCCQTGLNCRPLHYQWSALPLSYGSMPGIGNRPKWPPTRRPVLATRAPLAQARGRAGKGSKSSKTGAEDSDIRQFDKFGPYSGSRSRPDCGSRRPSNICGVSRLVSNSLQFLVMPGPIPGMLSSHESTPYQVLRFRMT